MVIVNDAIRDALAASRAAYARRDVRLDVRLAATIELDTFEPALYQALYSIFRALPERVEPGSTVKVTTEDRAGGDIELAWEARESAWPEDGEASGTRDVLAHGPHGDLLELATLALEEICRARTGWFDRSPAAEAAPESPWRERRVVALIPPRVREPGGFESAGRRARAP